MHRIAGLMSYDAHPYGIAFYASDMNAPRTPTVEIQLTPADIVFVMCGVITRYGLENTQGMLADIVNQDPTGRCVGLSGAARILETGKSERS